MADRKPERPERDNTGGAGNTDNNNGSELRAECSDEISPDVLAAWPADQPPADFVDRVIAATRGPDSQALPQSAANGEHSLDVPRWQRALIGRPSRAINAAATLIGGICIGAVAVGVFSAGDSSDRPSNAMTATSAGPVNIRTRTTAALGRRGVAVIEPGTDMSWQVDKRGAASVWQGAGEVFYRVDPIRGRSGDMVRNALGARFVVHTPVADISVTGTCFRVEVHEMKLPKQALVGAALGAALVVTVYEGQVLVASGGHQRSVEAGQKAVVSSRGAVPDVVTDDSKMRGVFAEKPSGSEEFESAPSPDLSRAELVARDKVQRKKLAELRAQVDSLERALRDSRRSVRQARSEDDDGRPWFDPGPELLHKFARECRVRYDVPPILRADSRWLTPDRAQQLGLSETEHQQVNQTLAEMHARWKEQLRQLYIEATGDTSGADSLSMNAMARELWDKSLPGETERIQQRIARERAGMIEPPADWSRASPIERYFRRLGALGDEMEAALGRKLGRDKARALREQNQGWGSRMEVAGCPGGESTRQDHDVDE
ncbi:MAG: hypothetical protein MJE77_25590 [Proteobacteria bacterium]|nr:hypothetical protein [Pseudomonadota bacterium]